MDAPYYNALLAFGEGLVLIISPCILPILPIILSGSLTGSKKRPFGIILGFIVIFALFTLFSRQLIQWLHIEPDTLRIFSLTILILIAILMISDKLSEWFNKFTSRLTGFGANFSIANNSQGGFFSGLLFGGLIAIIWTPCAGPILAAVIVQVVIQKTSAASILTVFAFGLGAGIPMLLIALFGRKVIKNVPYLKMHTRMVQKILGAIILLSVIYMIFSPLNTVANETPMTPETPISSNLMNALNKPYRAPAINGIDAWINSNPIILNQLLGKVVLIDFWTYSCINCIRTLPYLKNWYQKYHNKGLEIIGVHSPEFIFEQNIDNVKNAVKKFGILYPVALDNHFVTWQNFNNRFWPSHYLINVDGEVVYQHFGEGDYDVTENNIRYLLGMDKIEKAQGEYPAYSAHQTPETYLGYVRSKNYAGSPSIKRDEIADYHLPNKLSKHRWALGGKWEVSPEKITSRSHDATFRIHFIAKKVYIVTGSSKPNAVTIYFNDQKPKTFIVNQNQLYTLLDLPKLTDGIVELHIKDPDIEIYSLTFGS